MRLTLTWASGEGRGQGRVRLLRRPKGGQHMAGKYPPLYKPLLVAAMLGDGSIQLGLDETERLVGGLPPSARNYREWWANGGHTQAKAWMDAGWAVAMVNHGAGSVRFERDATAVRRSGEPSTQVSPPTTAARRPSSTPRLRG